MTDRGNSDETSQKDADREGTDKTDANREGTDRTEPQETELTYGDDRESPSRTDTEVDGDVNTDEGAQPKPLGDLAATVSERSDTDRSKSGSPDFDDLFDSQDVADIDGDRLWEQLEADESVASNDDLTPTKRTVHEIEKRSYCQDCEYFADPPDVACSRKGTEILAVPTMTTVRVADCPFVREDEMLEDSS
ncbi:hypothetical protein [Natrinema halophilum]|uniref:DUF8135 domain-containing protein n=1 Tax=Natrinema halophilum TaxID=1699371 RepID=A0A7D5GJD6_9EURY|nr:hypothetical protein [Natrinema halophilum]QLG48310.1 hypothetical protein HYG82_05325 [Natrinema halophilum]